MAKSRTRSTRSTKARADDTAAKGKNIQKKIDKKSTEEKTKDKSAMQAGARKYPVPPLPKQHLRKPGLKSDLELAPMYDAPHYKGSDKLTGMVALITGANSGIGRAVALLFAREGADIAIAYLNEHEDAKETLKGVEKEGRRGILLPGDVADQAFCKDAVSKTVAEFGRLDILVNNALSQEHVNEFEELSADTLRSDAKDKSLWLLLHGTGRCAPNEDRKLDHNDRLGDSIVR